MISARSHSSSLAAWFAVFVRRAGALPFVASVLMAAALLVSGARAATDGQLPADRVEIVTAKGPVGFTVEVADTDEARAKGLMFRTEMAPDRGMLFDFRRDEPVWFWMKNTYLPLDMIFARADGTIVSIAENTTPLSEATVPSGAPVRFVLEVIAGTSARLGIHAGDRMRHARVRAVP